MTPKLQSRDISVVVQGAIAGRPTDPARRQVTKRVLESIRRHLPDAEIILSTWTGSEVPGLDLDHVIFSTDPGAPVAGEFPDGSKLLYNVNRQTVSTRAGIERATRPMLLKWRTDLLMTHGRILDFHGRYPARQSEWAFASERMVVCSHFTTWPYRMERQAFTVSDWVMLGRRADMESYWSEAPPYPDEWVRWYDSHPDLRHARHAEPQRFVAEQHLWLSFLRRFREIPCEHAWDFGAHNAALHLQALVNNAIVASPSELGLRFLKQNHGPLNHLAMTEHADWRYLYRLFCDPLHTGVPTFRHWWRGRAADALVASPALWKAASIADYQLQKWSRWWRSK